MWSDGNYEQIVKLGLPDPDCRAAEHGDDGGDRIAMSNHQYSAGGVGPDGLHQSERVSDLDSFRTKMKAVSRGPRRLLRPEVFGDINRVQVGVPQDRRQQLGSHLALR